MEKVKLPKLPYSYDALEPVISKKIMELHHSKHHQTYVNATNSALEKLEKARNGEIEIDLRAVLRDLSFNLNGHLLHCIFWENMRPPRENNEPDGKIMSLIERNFGSFENFVNEFSLSANTVEGSGWAILFKDDNDNLIVSQAEKHNLMHIAGFKPILVLDVWEHAYYLDYLNNKAEYVKNWWKVVNWEDVEKRIET